MSTGLTQPHTSPRHGMPSEHWQDLCNLTDKKHLTRADPALQEYMCYFLHRWIDFRKAEVVACASMAGVHTPVWRAPFGSQPLSPFWYLRLPSDAVAAQIADRALLIKVRFCYCSLPCSRPAFFCAQNTCWPSVISSYSSLC